MKKLTGAMAAVALFWALAGFASTDTPGTTVVEGPVRVDQEAPKAVLVTGASSGIGRKITEVLAGRGYFVYAGARKNRIYGN
jgi:NADPH:quinone reductase-like Zn-dependent oxidoreductase